MRRWLVITLAILLVGVLAIGVIGLVGVPTTSGIAPPEDPEPGLIKLDTGQELWPYYSSQVGEFEQRSAINMVFLNASTRDVVDLLAGDSAWLEIGDELEDAGTEAFSFAELEHADAENPLGWGHAVGANRYAYSRFDGDSHWLAESAQLHDGDYFGSRDHLRLYDLPGDRPAVAIQAHAEHFDWFTLRHTVTSLDGAQSSAEADVMEVLGPESVTRSYYGNTEVYDSNGWVTIVAAMIPMLVVGVASERRRESPAATLLHQVREQIRPEHLILAAAMVAIMVSVRWLGIVLERYSELHVHGIAAGLFPVVGIGLPVTAYVLGRRFNRRIDAAVSASIGLGIAILVDYLYLGVTVLPIEILLHRGGLIIAIGLIAAGGCGHALGRPQTRGFILGGTGLWIVLLAVSLFSLL